MIMTKVYIYVACSSGHPKNAKPGSVGNCDISELATGLFTQLVEIVDGSLHVPRNIEQLSMDALEAPCTTVIKNKIFYIL